VALSSRYDYCEAVRRGADKGVCLRSIVEPAKILWKGSAFQNIERLSSCGRPKKERKRVRAFSDLDG
jgi:hypothetical protein